MKLILSALFSIILAVAVFGQSPSKVLQQAEKALGGSKALKSVRAVTRTGTIKRTTDGVSGKYLSQTSQPNLFNVSYDIGGFETESGYNGRSGWTRNSRDGLRTLTGKPSVDLQARAIYSNSRWLNYKDQKAKITSGGRATVDGKPANVVVLTKPNGVAIKLFFDVATGLPVREEIPNGELTEAIEYGDYRVVNGVKQAFLNRMSIGDERYEIALDNVAVHQPAVKTEFDFPAASNEPLPDIEALLKAVKANQERLEEMLDDYSYTQMIAKRELGKDGVLRETESEAVQMSFYKGNRITRVIEKNGKPLNEKQQADADKDAAKQVEEIEKKLAKQEKNAGLNPEDEARRLSIAEVMRASRLINPRRERFRGRDVIVFDFEPNPDFDTKNAKSILKLFGKLAGVVWVDDKDRQVARVEAVLADSFKIGGGVLAKLQKGASLTAEQDRVNDEVWLPSQAEVNLAVRVLLLKGMNINQVMKSYDYRKFQTEVKDAKVGDVKDPETIKNP
jgi:hypothetical protein